MAINKQDELCNKSPFAHSVLNKSVFLSPWKADAIFYFLERMSHKGYFLKKELLQHIHLLNVHRGNYSGEGFCDLIIYNLHDKIPNPFVLYTC